MYDCQYCYNRRSNDVPRALFTPDEVADLTISFYKRNYIEGLFLSSSIIKSPDYTMELMFKTISLVRNKYNFNGYIHAKAIPGADPALINALGFLVDRMSVNIELPSSESLKKLAPEKSKEDIIRPMGQVKNAIIQSKNEVALFRHAPQFVPAGQSTQLIVGATQDTDRKIIGLSENLYKKFSLKRVFYSAYLPMGSNPQLPTGAPPLLREHRLYQADWLLRFYKFKADEILNEKNENLSLNYDPKCNYAIQNMHLFPVEINTADHDTLLRVPGIGLRSARKIVESRRVGKLDFYNLKKLGIVLKRAKYFITCNGKMYEKVALRQEILEIKLSEHHENTEQLTVFDLLQTEMTVPTMEDEIKCITGEI